MTLKKYIIFVLIMLALQMALADDIVFIVNAANPIERINLFELRDFYFKRKRQWSHGEYVRFIDRNSGALRSSFLKNYIGKSSSDVDLYWIGQKLYSGDSAPLRESSNATTVSFVASLKGSIGYVSDVTVLNKDVKVVKVETSGD